jgi:uncharacterized membrane protein YfcA
VDPVLIIALVFIGIVGGFLSGLVGIGGGIIFIPILDFYFKSQGIEGQDLVRFILANSFLTVIFAGIVSTLRQYKADNFFLKEILLTALPALISGLALSYLITKFDWYSESAFKWLFVIMLLLVSFRFFFKTRSLVKRPKEGRINFLMTGLLTGLASALSGLGGGIIMIPAFTSFMGLSMKKASSISVGVIPILLLPMAIYYAVSDTAVELFSMQWGFLVPFVVLPMVCGILIGAPFGVMTGHKINNRKLEIIFAVIALVILVKYLIELLYKK